MAYQRFTDSQVAVYANHEKALADYGLEIMERAILQSREIPIAHYPNGNWYSVYVIHSPEDGTPFYVMRDGESLSEKDFNNWIDNKPASLTIVMKYYSHYKAVMQVSKKLMLRREILEQQEKRRQLTYAC